MVFKPFQDMTKSLNMKLVEESKSGDECSGANNLKARDIFLFFIFIPFNALLFVATLILNFFAGMPELSNGLFINGITNVSRMFEVNITPIGETFGIWAVIYTAQIISVLYGLSLMFRLTGSGLAYANPAVMNRNFYLLSMFSNTANIVWLFLWDRMMAEAAAVTLLIIALMTMATTAVAARRQQEFRSTLIDANRSFDISTLSIFVVNGWGLYATWTVVAAHVSLAIVLTYNVALDNEIASLISLGILITLTLIYSGLDVFLLGRYTRSLLSPYAVLLWASIGITAKDYDASRYTSIVGLIFAIFSFFALLFRISLLFFLPRFRPGFEKGNGEDRGKKIDIAKGKMISC